MQVAHAGTTGGLLAPGARVAVVAPSGVVAAERIEVAVERLRGWGLEPVVGSHLYARERYLAGSIGQRRADLVVAMLRPDVDAIWIARGGYGAVQLLEGLPWEEWGERPILGFSDATALFAAMRKVGVRGAVHAPVLNSLVGYLDARSETALARFVLEDRRIDLPGVQLGGPSLGGSGETEVGTGAPVAQTVAERVAATVAEPVGETVVAPVVGGNLCVLASLAGTPWAIRSEGCILLLEDIGEVPYKLDRLITQLMLSGALDGVRGIALGEFTSCEAPAGAGYTAEEVVVSRLGGLGVPIVGRLPVGHGPTNFPVRLGHIGRLYAGGLVQAAQ